MSSEPATRHLASEDLGLPAQLLTDRATVSLTLTAQDIPLSAKHFDQKRI